MNNNILTEKERDYIRHQMENLLDEYNYEYSTFALNKIIDTWARQKVDLIEAFKKHPNYVEGEFLIAFNQNWNREIDPVGTKNFARWIGKEKDALMELLPEYVKEKGLEQDYFGNIPYPVTSETSFLVYSTNWYAHQFLSQDMANYFNTIDESMKFREGMKTSRAINKICQWLGFNKHPDYNREFAKFADSVNPLKITRHTVISINPLDYLTMSFGNSWASCHTIDKQNRRGMPNSYEGQYSSGTMSYMLDKVSMVFYTVDAAYNGNEYYTQSKINRCMFHYGEDKLIQGRVYPQSNDSNSDGIYKEIREIVQRVIATCLDIPNYWTTKRGTYEINKYVWSDGTHYTDYTNFDNCCICFPKEMEINEEHITIGHDPICIECGHEHSESETINHCGYYAHTCEDCGCALREDEVVWVGDYAYCSDCVTWCDHCDRYMPNGEVRWLDSINQNVCEECLEEDFIWCDECEEYHRDYNVQYVESEGNNICDNCLENYFALCEECNEWYRTEDMEYDEASGYHYCESCWEEINEEENEEECEEAV